MQEQEQEIQAEDISSADESAEVQASIQVQRGDILFAQVDSVDDEQVTAQIQHDEFTGTVVIPSHDLAKADQDRRDLVISGAVIPVYITETGTDTYKGSYHQALSNENWLRVQALKESGEIQLCKVVGYSTRGLVAMLDELRGFVPVVQMANVPRRANPNQMREWLGSFVGQSIPVRVVDVDRRRRRLILSHRRAYSAWREQEKLEFLKSLKVGEVRAGRVRQLREFGVFVDLGGGDGLVHISELAWHRVKHPKELVRIGERIRVKILRVDMQRKRVALSVKRLLPEPWEQVDQKYHGNQLVEGIIKRLAPFGAFVEIEPGIEGLVHLTEIPMARDQEMSDVIAEGQVHLIRILSIDSRDKRMRLSLRRVSAEEQSEWMFSRAESQSKEGTEEIIGLEDITGEEE